MLWLSRYKQTLQRSHWPMQAALEPAIDESMLEQCAALTMILSAKALKQFCYCRPCCGGVNVAGLYVWLCLLGCGGSCTYGGWTGALTASL